MAQQVVVQGRKYYVQSQSPTSDPAVDTCVLVSVYAAWDIIIVDLEVAW